MKPEDLNKYNQLKKELEDEPMHNGEMRRQENEGHKYSIEQMEVERKLDKQREYWGEEYDVLVENGVTILRPLDREEFCNMAVDGGSTFLEKDGKGMYLKFRRENEGTRPE